MMSLKLFKAVMFLLFSAACTVANAQFNKNAIYGNFGGPLGFGMGLKYDRVIIGGKYFHLNMNLGLGYSFSNNESYNKLAKSLYVPTNLGVSIGTKKHFLEASGGPMTSLNVGFQEKADFYALPTLVGAQMQLGYKYVSPYKLGFYFKVYGSGLFLAEQTADEFSEIESTFRSTLKAKMQPGLGISLGCAF